MRLSITTHGKGCLEVGRLDDGRLGVIGQDNAFGNDGRFHPLPAALAATSPDCVRLDGQGRLIHNEIARRRSGIGAERERSYRGRPRL
jgi:hypothetical protein